MKRYLACLTLALLALGRPAWSMTEAERRQYLEKLLQTLPDVPSFTSGFRRPANCRPTSMRFRKSMAFPTR
jgi:hypothetical protein